MRHALSAPRSFQSFFHSSTPLAKERFTADCPCHGTDEAVAKQEAGAADFPFLFPQAEALGLEVYHLGFHSRDSFAATPWLARNPATGVGAIVDCPRYSSKLHKAIEAHFGQGKVMLLSLCGVGTE